MSACELCGRVAWLQPVSLNCDCRCWSSETVRVGESIDIFFQSQRSTAPIETQPWIVLSKPWILNGFIGVSISFSTRSQFQLCFTADKKNQSLKFKGSTSSVELSRALRTFEQTDKQRATSGSCSTSRHLPGDWPCVAILTQKQCHLGLPTARPKSCDGLQHYETLG